MLGYRTLPKAPRLRSNRRPVQQFRCLSCQHRTLSWWHGAAGHSTSEHAVQNYAALVRRISRLPTALFPRALNNRRLTRDHKRMVAYGMHAISALRAVRIELRSARPVSANAGTPALLQTIAMWCTGETIETLCRESRTSLFRLSHHHHHSTQTLDGHGSSFRSALLNQVILDPSPPASHKLNDVARLFLVGATHDRGVCATMTISFQQGLSSS